MIATTPHRCLLCAEPFPTWEHCARHVAEYHWLALRDQEMAELIRPILTAVKEGVPHAPYFCLHCYPPKVTQFLTEQGIRTHLRSVHHCDDGDFEDDYADEQGWLKIKRGRDLRDEAHIIRFRSFLSTPGYGAEDFLTDCGAAA